VTQRLKIVVKLGPDDDNPPRTIIESRILEALSWVSLEAVRQSVKEEGYREGYAEAKSLWYERGLEEGYFEGKMFQAHPGKDPQNKRLTELVKIDRKRDKQGLRPFNPTFDWDNKP